MSLNEKKFFDLDVGTFTAGAGSLALTTSWVFTQPLINIIQGTTALTRIGNKIFCHAIYYQVIMTPTTGMGANGGVCRFTGIHDNSNSGDATPNATNIWQADSVYTLRNSAQMPRYRITSDMSHVYTPVTQNSGAVNTVGPTKIFNFAQFPRKVISYIKSDATDATCLLKDNYYAGYVCSVAGCTVAMKVKIVFSDA